MNMGQADSDQEVGDYVKARMYAGRVTITGHVMEKRLSQNGHPMYCVLVTGVEADDWPYPPAVGDTPWIAGREIVHQHAKGMLDG